MKKITLKYAIYIAAVCFAAIACIFYYQLRSPLPGASFRYEASSNGVTRIGWFTSERLENMFLHAVAPSNGDFEYWASVTGDEGPTENGDVGIVLFRGNGAGYAFLPYKGNATAVSSSPLGRVVAVISDIEYEISFFAMPELKSLGSIVAAGPVLWKDSVSGKAFTRNGEPIAFTMAPKS